MVGRGNGTDLKLCFSRENPTVARCLFPLPKGVEVAIASYQKRMGIEEMFRDFKKGGYDLERTKLTGHRLTSLTLLITLAYCQATLAGKVIKDKGVAKYGGRVKEKNRFSRRHSDFYLGLNGKDWLLSWQLLSGEAQALMQLSPQKRANYQQELMAVSHIQYSF